MPVAETPSLYYHCGSEGEGTSPIATHPTRAEPGLALYEASYPSHVSELALVLTGHAVYKWAVLITPLLGSFPYKPSLQMPTGTKSQEKKIISSLHLEF